MNATAKLEDLQRRLANARRRARYWAGLPPFAQNGGHSMSRIAKQRLSLRGTNHELEYETALCDCECLAISIEQLTGTKPKVVDYKSQFNAAFSKLNHSAP